MDDFEQKLNECHTKGVDDEAVVEKASKASAAARARDNGGRSAGQCLTISIILWSLKGSGHFW